MQTHKFGLTGKLVPIIGQGTWQIRKNGLDALRAGVQAVLHQLLDDGRRALDDLAGGDLIDEVIVEYADRHGRAV